jgi:hypothetical protein
MHWALKPDPDLKGTYYRRIEDIERAFDKMDADGLPTAARFLVRYFGCEKLAQGIVGVAKGCPPGKVYGRGNSPPGPNQISHDKTKLDLPARRPRSAIRTPPIQRGGAIAGADFGAGFAGCCRAQLWTNGCPLCTKQRGCHPSDDG